jgi:hypothetical protein
MRYLAAGIAFFVLAYPFYFGVTWYEYGHVQDTAAESTDGLRMPLCPHKACPWDPVQNPAAGTAVYHDPGSRSGLLSRWFLG